MSTRFDQIVADAMKLPLRDRVRLAQQLVSTIDDQTDTDVEGLWFDEAQRRLEELHTVRSKALTQMKRSGAPEKI